MTDIQELPIVPRNWVDPILRASQARALLAQPHHVLLALGMKGEVGHLLARIMPGSPADILTLHVREQHRRQGHARKLLDALIARAQPLGCKQLTLEVRAGNQAARRLYEKMGLKQAAIRKAYYADPVEDAVVYTLKLG